MTQELTPNTQITQANVGLLPCPFCGGEASVRTVLRAMVCCDECGAESRSFSMTVCGTDAAASEAVAAWNHRPALSPPAEGSDPYGPLDNSAIFTAPADHIGDATEKVDWTVVGPKLVEALAPFIKAAGRLDGLWAEDDYRWNTLPQYAVTVGDLRRLSRAAALAAAQPQSNGE